MVGALTILSCSDAGVDWIFPIPENTSVAQANQLILGHWECVKSVSSSTGPTLEYTPQLAGYTPQMEFLQNDVVNFYRNDSLTWTATFSIESVVERGIRFCPAKEVAISLHFQKNNPKGGTDMAVKPIPDGYHSVTPYLIVSGVAKLLDFLKVAFEAKVTERMPRPDGTVMHAQVTIGDSVVMMGEAMGDFKPMPGSIYLYVDDTDAVYTRALAAGATSVMEPADQFYGDRNGGVKDASGNIWWIATHKEDVSREELERRAKDRYGK